MVIIELIVDILFFSVCGWVGHMAVKILTWGKVDLEWGDSSESVIAEWIGVGVLLALAMLVSVVVGRIGDDAPGESARRGRGPDPGTAMTIPVPIRVP